MKEIKNVLLNYIFYTFFSKINRCIINIKLLKIGVNYEKIEVVAGILKYNEKFFCAQRNSKVPLAMKWEFPGGKIEINETQEEALIRELKEELTIDINIDKFFMTVKYQYETFHLTMHTYICHCKNIEDINLLVHLDSRWLKLNELTDLDWAEADIPIIDRLLGE